MLRPSARESALALLLPHVRCQNAHSTPAHVRAWQDKRGGARQARART